jgi:hypothetical protein|tara:strand:- start:4609 stop:4941 length:333 start_codon:yes stop_codon:yes gene_type:complete
MNQGKQKCSNIDNWDKDIFRGVCPTLGVKEMYDLYLETVQQYKSATSASDYINCGVHCEKITKTLDEIIFGNLDDIEKKKLCRCLRSKILERVGDLHQDCLKKLQELQKK